MVATVMMQYDANIMNVSVYIVYAVSSQLSYSYVPKLIKTDK